MDIYLLKYKHKLDEYFEEIGVFSSAEKMEKAKKYFLEKSACPENEYEFTVVKMELDKLL